MIKPFFKILSLFVLMLARNGEAAPPTYRITPVYTSSSGPVTAMGISSSGDVLVSADSTTRTAFFWDATTRTLTSLGGLEPLGMSASGVVGGTTRSPITGGLLATSWDRGILRDLDVKPPNGGVLANARVRGIGTASQVFGSVTENINRTETNPRNFMVGSGGQITLSSEFTPTAINSSNLVAGIRSVFVPLRGYVNIAMMAQGSGQPVPITFAPIPGLQLDDLYPTVVLDDGSILGASGTSAIVNGMPPPGFHWKNGVATPLPALPQNVTGFIATQPRGMDAAGNIVGDTTTCCAVGGLGGQALLWNSGATYLLASRIDPNDPFLAGRSVQMNGVGGVAADGRIAVTARVTSNIGVRWMVLRLDPLVSGTVISTELIDPVPLGDVSTSLLDGAAITRDADRLRRLGRTVQGVAADGVTQVLLRIRTTEAGQNISIQVNPDQCSGRTDSQCIDEYGRIFDPINPAADIFGSTFNGTVTVTSQLTPEGPMAFAVYRAPRDFARSGDARFSSTDTTSTVRSVDLVIGQTSRQVPVIRPPVVVVHGLWASSSPDDLLSVRTSLESDSRFSVSFADYSPTVTIYNASPFYGSGAISDISVPGSSLGLKHGAVIVGREISRSLFQFKSGKKLLDNSPGNPIGSPFAATQVDIVAHSLGSLMSRYIQYMDSVLDSGLGSFNRPANFLRGDIHKLISIGGPHLGSPFAAEILKRDRPEDGGVNNACIRRVVQNIGSVPFSGVPNNGLVVIDTYGKTPNACKAAKDSSCQTGAIADLAGSGDGAVLNSELRVLGGGRGALSVAYIVGKISKKAVAALDGKTYNYMGTTYTRDGTNVDKLKATCSLSLVTAPLAKMMTSVEYPKLMRDESDGIVPLISQRNSNSRFSDITPAITILDGGLVHSGGGRMLGFGTTGVGGNVQTLLDGFGAADAIRLLNTSVQDSIFVRGQ